MTAKPLVLSWQRATRLIGRGRSASAARLLRHALTRFDPATAFADLDLIAAATLFARVGGKTPEAQLDWAMFAERASLRAYSPLNDLSITAAEALASVLQSQDLTPDAIIVLDRLAGAYDQREHIPGAVGTRHSLATLLHADGRCDEAQQQITIAYKRWSLHRDIPQLREWGARIVLSHAGILAGCGMHHAAIAVLQHREPVFDALGPVWCVNNGLCAYLDFADVLETHPPVCTRPAQTSGTADSVRTYLADHMGLPFEHIAHASPPTTGIYCHRHTAE